MIGVSRLARALAALAALVGGAPAAATQSAAMLATPLPVAHGFSVFRLYGSTAPRVTTPERAWSLAALADVAVGNSPTRAALGVLRLPPIASASPSFAGMLAVTHVVVEQMSPAWMAWVTGAVGVASLGAEGHDGSTTVDATVGLGVAQLFTPPGLGEATVSLVPRVQLRRLSAIPTLERSVWGVGATVTIDWGSPRDVGLFMSFEVERMSDRPLGDRAVQSAFRVGLSYRRELFRRRPRLPPGGP